MTINEKENFCKDAVKLARFLIESDRILSALYQEYTKYREIITELQFIMFTNVKEQVLAFDQMCKIAEIGADEKIIKDAVDIVRERSVADIEIKPSNPFIMLAYLIKAEGYAHGYKCENEYLRNKRES